MIKTKPILLLLIFFVHLSAQADFYTHRLENYSVTEKTWRLSPSLNYYDTDSNFDNSSTQFNPSPLQKYNRINTEILIAYGISDKFTPFARLNWSYVKMRDLSTQTSTFGFGDQTFGLNYALIREPNKKGVEWTLQAQVDFPGYNNLSAGANTPPLGDGSRDITLATFLDWPLGNNPNNPITIAHFGVGITDRSKDFSSAIPWHVGIEINPAPTGIFFGASTFGVVSLQTDPRSTVKTAGGSLAMGSFVYDARNPTLAHLRLDLGHHAASYELGAHLTGGILGTNAPKGITTGVYFNFYFNRSKNAEPSTDPTKIDPNEYEYSNRGAIEYGYDCKVTGLNDQLNMVRINKGRLGRVTNS